MKWSTEELNRRLALADQEVTQLHNAWLELRELRSQIRAQLKKRKKRASQGSDLAVGDTPEHT